MKKLLMFLIPAAFLLAAACHRDHDSRVNFIKNRISSELDLNEEQEAKLTDLTNAIRDQMKQGHKSSALDELRGLLDRPALDEAETKAFFDKHMAERTARMQNVYEAVYPKFAAFHASLNEAQRKKALDFIEKFHKKWHHD